MSSKAYEGEWENGIRYSHGAARFAGQTRDRLQDNGWRILPNGKKKYDEGIIIRTSYGILPIDNSVEFTGGMVATMSERIKPSCVVSKAPKENYIDKMLDQAAYEMGY